MNDLGLLIITPGQKKQVALTTSGGHPAWSPDGREIAFLDANGVSLVRPTDHVVLKLIPGNEAHPITSVAWSPDSKLIAFTTDRALYLAASDGSAVSAVERAQFFGFNKEGARAAKKAARALVQGLLEGQRDFTARVLVTGEPDHPEEVVEAWRLEGDRPVNIGRYSFE